MGVWFVLALLASFAVLPAAIILVSLSEADRLDHLELLRKHIVRSAAEDPLHSWIFVLRTDRIGGKGHGQTNLEVRHKLKRCGVASRSMDLV